MQPLFHPLTLAEVGPAADDALVLAFRVPPALRDTFRFQPGQALTLRAWVEGQELRRSYSVCAAPGEPLRVGVRCVPGGVFSSWLRKHARPGGVIDVMPPHGRLGAALQRPAVGRHVLLVAGGSGITPLLSIARTVLAAEPRSRVTLLYGNRTAASTMFSDELNDLKNRWLARLAVHRVFSRESVDVPLHGGRMDAAKLATLLRLAGPVNGIDEAFVCGPHSLNEDAEAALRRAGWRSAQVHVERFGVPPAAGGGLQPAASSGPAATALVSIVRDGIKRMVPFTAPDGSILAAAARAGLDLPFACRSGVCATCRARVLEGSVRMERNFALGPYDLQAGDVLVCQAQPLTDHVLLSFDER